jgi:hypothetical protein
MLEPEKAAPIGAKPAESLPFPLDGAPVGAAAQEPEVEPDLGEAALRGLGISYAPFAVEAKEPQTRGEMAAEIAANIAGDVLAAVAAGAIGGPVGLGLGVGFGLYRALGYEDYMRRLRKRDYDPVKAVANIVTEVNPFLRYGGKLFKGSVQGVFQALQAKQYGAPTELALGAGALGGGLVGLAAKPRAPKVLSDKEQAVAVAAMATDPTIPPGAQATMIDELTKDAKSARVLEVAEDLAKKNETYDSVVKPILTNPETFWPLVKGKHQEFFDIVDPLDIAVFRENTLPDLHPTLKRPTAKRARDLGMGTAAEYKELKAAGKEINSINKQLRSKKLKKSARDKLKARKLDLEMQIQEKSKGFKMDLNASEQHAIFEVLRKDANDMLDYILRSGKYNPKIGKIKHSPPTEQKLERVMKALGREGTSWEDIYDLRRINQYGTKAARHVLQEGLKRGDKLTDPGLMRNPLYRFFSDITFASRAIDNVAGTELEPLTNRIHYALQQANDFEWLMDKRLRRLIRAIKKTGIEQNKIRHLVEQPDKFDELTEGMSTKNRQKLHDLLFLDNEDADSWTKFFKDARQWALDNDIGLPELRDKDGNILMYFPHMTVPVDQAITGFRRFFRDLAKKDQVANSWIKGTDAEGARIALEQFVGEKITNAEQLRTVLNTRLADTKALKTRIGVEAQAAFERRDMIPEFLLEEDAYRAGLNYIRNLGRSAHVTPAIRALETQVPLLKSMGFEKSAEYLMGRIRKLSGKESEFGRWSSAQSTRLKTYIDRLLDEKELRWPTRAGLNLVKYTPDLLSFGVGQIYPNYLGFSVRAYIRNLTQPFMTSAPEIGGGIVNQYGYQNAMRGTIKTWATMLRHGPEHIKRQLKEMGYHQSRPGSEGFVTMHNSLRNTLIAPLLHVSDKYAHYAMYLYDLTDAINRYTTINMVKQITKDLVAGKKRALQFLGNLEEGYKSRLARMLKAGAGADEIERELAEFLLGKTQFHYGGHALSDYGQYMGRFFSMFTKWPAMIYGDMAELASKGKWGQMTKRYFAPWAALAAIGSTIGDEDIDPRQRALLGQALTTWSPMSALQVSMPPVMELGKDSGAMLLDLLAGDIDRLTKERVATLLKPITPLAGIKIAIDRNYWGLYKNKENSWNF